MVELSLSKSGLDIELLKNRISKLGPVNQLMNIKGYVQWLPLKSLGVLFYEAKLPFSETEVYRNIKMLSYH